MSNPFIPDPDSYERKIKAMWIKADDGTTFHCHGTNGGAEGIWLAKGQVHGIYDAPVKTSWKSPAFADGGQQIAVKKLQRDLSLGFHCIDTPGRTFEGNEAEFRKAFSYELDEWDDDASETVVGIETDISGVRMLDVLMHETPVFDPDVDPVKQQYGNLIMGLRAGQPMWYSDTVITVFEDSGSSGSGTITISNPTDQPMYHLWVLTRAKWTVPDFSWRGKKYNRVPGGPYASRTIEMPLITADNGGAVISLDTKELMVRDAHYTNLLPLLGGKYFMHCVPPYTPETLLPISYTNAPAGGARAELHQPRRWSRPWGLE